MHPKSIDKHSSYQRIVSAGEPSSVSESSATCTRGDFGRLKRLDLRSSKNREFSRFKDLLWLIVITPMKKTGLRNLLFEFGDRHHKTFQGLCGSECCCLTNFLSNFLLRCCVVEIERIERKRRWIFFDQCLLFFGAILFSCCAGCPIGFSFRFWEFYDLLFEDFIEKLLCHRLCRSFNSFCLRLNRLCFRTFFGRIQRIFTLFGSPPYFPVHRRLKQGAKTIIVCL